MRFETKVDIAKGLTIVQTVETTGDDTIKETILDVKEFVANSWVLKGYPIKPFMVRVKKVA